MTEEETKIRDELTDRAIDELFEGTEHAEYKITVYMREEISADYYSEEGRIMMLEGYIKVPELSNDRIEVYFDPIARNYIEVKSL